MQLARVPAPHREEQKPGACGAARVRIMCVARRVVIVQVSAAVRVGGVVVRDGRGCVCEMGTRQVLYAAASGAWRVLCDGGGGVWAGRWRGWASGREWWRMDRLGSDRGEI